MSNLEQLNHLKTPLQAIKSCTQDFNESNLIGKGGYGRVYKGILSWAHHKDLPVAVKRLDVTGFQGNKEFYTEIAMLSRYRHKNIITLLGFCDESKEMILVYEYASNGSLDAYLSDSAKPSELSWEKRLKICSGAASALNYLHNHVAAEHRVIHRDIKSANILLDEDWNAKLSDFGLSRIGLANQQDTFLITNVAGTHGYCDPQYERTGILTKESDVYSFGVVLFELLCGRLVYVPKYHDERRFLHHFARTCYNNGNLEDIIDRQIKEHIKPVALRKFSAIAYQCLQETRGKRPTIAEVAHQLQISYFFQDCSPHEAALTIQKNFRLFMMRKRRLDLNDLYKANAKLKNLESLFNDGTYRSWIADDEDERIKYIKKIMVLLVTVNAIAVKEDPPAADVMTLKKSIVDKLKEMIDVVDPWLKKDHWRRASYMLDSVNKKGFAKGMDMIIQKPKKPHEAALTIQKNFRLFMIRKMIGFLSNLDESRINDRTYRGRIRTKGYDMTVFVLLAMADPSAYAKALKRGIALSSRSHP